ncbi:MAG: sigma-54-dependent transcriptional regulator, partial [Planctomycetota bacterium]
MARIVVVDDEPIMRDAVRDALTRAGHDVAAFGKGAPAAAHAEHEPVHLVITDLKMPGMDGMAVLQEMRKHAPDAPVVMITAHGTVESAVAAMKRGAYDYIQKPFELEELEMLVARALEHRALAAENEVLRARVADAGPPSVWSGETAALRQALEKAAGSDSTVLITGESGAGKEVAAQALHRMSP